MDFESPDVEKDFPGLYASEIAKSRSQERDSDYSDEEKVSRKELLIGKRRERKESKKDKGYVAFEGESSEDEMDETRSPAKTKKTKAPFKFPGKDKKEKSIKIKELKETKKEEEKDSKESRKEKEKEHKKKKGKLARFDKKEKKKKVPYDLPKGERFTKKSEDKPIFGVPLHIAVERNRSHDGIELPVVVRECIDYVEEHGLSCEGIYQISGVKSKVRHLRSQYNQGEKVYLYEHEPHIVASLLKHFLRELPEPVLTNELMPKFEEAAALKNEHKKVESLSKLIENLPTCNRLLLSYMFVHMLHIIQLEKRNKMNLQNVSIVLSPTMQISHRVLHALFAHNKLLFNGIEIKKYVPPLRPETSRLSLELPDTPAAIEDELNKQENLLNELHAELNTGLRDKQKEEQLWEIQRIVTQLKRKLRFLKQVQEKQCPNSGAGDEIQIDTRLQQVKEETSQEKLQENDTPSPKQKHETIEINEQQIKETKEKEPSPQTVDKSPLTPQVDVKEIETINISVDETNNRVQINTEVHDVVEEVVIEEQAQKTVITTVSQEESITVTDEKISEEPENEEAEKEVINKDDDDDDEEMQSLLHEERMLLLQQEELLLLGEELKRKISTEHSEVERLRVEISEYQQLYKYKQYSFDSSENSSETDSSDSDAEDEEELQQVLEELIKENQELEKKNAEVTRQIQQEREACMMIKIQMKLLQQESKPLRM